MIGPHIIRSFRRLGDESGQTIVLAAVGMAVIVAFLGLAIDVGQVRLAKRRLQKAADAAALAGAIEVLPCLNVSACTAMQTAAADAVTENGLATPTVVLNCASVTPSTSVTLLLNNGPCSISTDPNKGKTTFVEAVVSQQQKTTFARLIGISRVSLTARAEAQHISQTNCVYALDPSASGAMTLAALAVVTANCGIVVESSSTSAIACGLIGSLTAPSIDVTGSSLSGLLCGTPTVLHTGVPVPSPADPLAYLTKPTVGACGSGSGATYHGSASAVAVSTVSELLTGPVTFWPGRYCGGISIGLLATATFQPGTYILTSTSASNGGISINVNSTVTGNGVTFYNYGPNGGVNFVLPLVLVLGNINLTAPTSGTYAGILFFQDPGNTTASTILASISLSSPISGVSYFPTATVNYDVGVSLSAPCTTCYNPLVAKDINFLVSLSTSANFNGSTSNYSTLPNGSPLYSTKAVLVQ